MRYFLLLPATAGILLLSCSGFAHELTQDPSSTVSGSSIVIAMNLLVLSILYIIGWIKERHRFPQKKGRSSRLLSFFIASQVTLSVALLSPLDKWSEHLAWVHMLQHILLMMLAAPLMAVSSLGYIFQWVVPANIARHLWIFKWKFQPFLDRLGSPAFIILLFAFILWLWHLPTLYEKALTADFFHNLQHLSFFLASYWFWEILINPLSKRLLHPGLALFYVFVTSIHTMLLGVFMTLSPRVWYEIYKIRAPRIGWNPLIDQQLAGLIMWMPGGLAYLAVTILIFARAVSEGRSVSFGSTLLERANEINKQRKDSQ